jgi:hypothetical protein
MSKSPSHTPNASATSKSSTAIAYDNRETVENLRVNTLKLLKLADGCDAALRTEVERLQERLERVERKLDVLNARMGKTSSSS